jgi:hypothetical protein
MPTRESAEKNQPWPGRRRQWSAGRPFGGFGDEGEGVAAAAQVPARFRRRRHLRRSRGISHRTALNVECCARVPPIVKLVGIAGACVRAVRASPAATPSEPDRAGTVGSVSAAACNQCCYKTKLP